MQLINFLTLVIITFVLLFGCVTQTNQEGDVLDDDLSHEQIDDSSVSINNSDNLYSGSCPKGKVDELCTGECSQFIDLDNDGYCDRSQ